LFIDANLGSRQRTHKPGVGSSTLPPATILTLRNESINYLLSNKFYYLIKLNFRDFMWPYNEDELAFLNK